MKKVIFAALIAVVAVYAISFVVVNFVRIVRPGYAGALEFCGYVYPSSYKNGLHTVWPGSQMHVFNIMQQKHEYTMKLKTSSMQDVTVKGAIIYNLNADNVHRLYQNVGEQYQPVIITPLLEGALNETIGKQTPEFIVNSQEMIREAVLYIVKDQLEQTELVSVNDLRLFRPQFDEKFEEAIKDKVVAQQIAEKAKFETKRVEEEAAQMRKKMEAEAYGLNLKSKALNNPLIVRYEYAKAMGKWEGKLPNTLVVGQNGTMPVLPIGK